MAVFGQTPFPKLDAPFVDENGNITFIWYKLIITIWQAALGSGKVVLQDSAYLQTQHGAAPVGVYNFLGEFLGDILFTGPGQPEEILPVVLPSPFIFVAPKAGFLVVNKAQVEIARSGPFYLSSVMGGATPMKENDSARLTWFGDDLPQAIWFPDL